MNIESFETRSIEDRNLVPRKFRISYTYFKELKFRENLQGEKVCGKLYFVHFIFYN